MTDDLRSLCCEEFVKIVTRFDIREGGLVEYLLWETIEGTRDRPFKLLDPLSEEEMDVLRVMRDEVKFWLYWKDGWEMVDIEGWKKHAATRTAHDVIAEMQAQTKVS
jgi:hypothetical protein